MSKFYFGQFQYTQSFFHKLNSTVKILLVFYFIIIIFFFKTIQAYLLFFLFCLVLTMFTKINFRSILLSFKPILFLLFFTIFFQLLFTQGTPLIHLGKIVITKEGLDLSIFIALRLVILTFLTFLLTSTTTTVDLATGFKNIAQPLKILKFPVDELSLMISISLQFVPILFDEADRIMKAQMARGADFESGNIFVRAKSFLPVIIPLVLNAFNRADELAIAMEARGFVIGAKRTSIRENKLGRNEFLAIGISIIITLLLFILEVRINA
ncbi:MAG: energy-coupling factor transporter transmembrane protein EcfT [Caldisericaceae bacterium]